MRISPINIKINTGYNQKNIIKPQENETNNITKLSNFYYPIAFSGGNSMSLEETKKKLDKIPNAYPPDMENKIKEVLASGNPEDKTLIDVHKDKYQYLNLCETLDDAKATYPEFKDVFSDNQVIFQQGSFLDDVKSGLVRGFDPDVDVALQLLQLYWGEGFSLTTLKDDYADKNVHYTFQKLGIPRVNNVYGQYLKLSDKDYNKRYTDTMSERAKEIERKRIEKKEGIYVPKGPITGEQKTKISESLKKYYSENPEKIQEMSDRQKKFYEENPLEKEKLSQVGIRAWNYKEADSVKKKLAKFLKKQKLTEEDIIEISTPDSKHNAAFKTFWEKNGWAKDIISSCMKKSWKRQDALSVLGLIYEPLYEIEVLPKPMMEKINKGYEDYHDINLKYVIMNPKDEKSNTVKYLYSKDDFIRIMSQKNAINKIIYSFVPNVMLAKTYTENNNSYTKEVNKIFEQYSEIIKKYIDKPEQDEHNGYCFEAVMDLFDEFIKNNDTKNIKLLERTIQEVSEKTYACFVDKTITLKQWENYYNQIQEKAEKVFAHRKHYTTTQRTIKDYIMETLLAQAEQNIKK
ncbi:hypothetical protein IJ182_00625 [bacterium]|nr:hypothetical protein [bacterium]